MKKFILIIVLAVQPVFAVDKVVIRTEIVAEYLCSQVWNAFNVPACKESFQSCIDYNMSLRIFIDADTGVRYIWSMNNCLRKLDK